MNIFYRPKYRSEVTSFIDELKAKDPALEAKQRQGRDLLWDQNVDRKAWVGYRDGEVEQQPYVYQTNPEH